MPVTLQQARLRLRQHLGEDYARAWTDNSLDQWIHDGCKDLAKKCEMLQATSDISVTAGTQQVTAPTNQIRAYRAEWINAGSQHIPLEYRDFNNADTVWWTSQTTTSGTPMMFTMWGVVPSLKIVLYPKPAESGTLRVMYYRLPTDPRASSGMDANLLDIPEGWDDAVYLYAEYMALRRDRDPRWQEAKSLYDEQAGILFDLSRSLSDQPGQSVGGGGLLQADSWLWTGSEY